MSRTIRAGLMFAGLTCIAALALLAVARTAPGPAVPPDLQVPDSAPRIVIDRRPPPVPPIRPVPRLRPFPCMDYPLNRVRAKRSESMALQPCYLDNRVVFRRIRIEPSGEGMRIGGEVVVDFDCDKAPAELKLEAGAIMDLRIDVQLFEITAVLTRGHAGKVEDIREDRRFHGRPIDGQSVQCRTESSIADGGPEFGLASFELPALPRPLAPGVYNLVATLTFLSQGESQLQRIKWCSDFWGAEDLGIDPVNGQRVLHPVLGDAVRHRRFFAELTHDARKVEGSARIYLADTLEHQRYAGTPPGPNCVVLGQLAQRIRAVEDLAQHADLADREFEQILSNPKFQTKQLSLLRAENPWATPADLIRHWQKLTIILKDNARDNLAMLGGPASEAEKHYCASADEARDFVLEQIRQWQDRLRLQYWIFRDGVLLYDGWHRINRPAREAYDLIKGDNAARPPAAPRDWEALERAWNRQPTAIRAAAFAYLRDLDEGRLAGNQFVMKKQHKLMLDLARCRDFRAEWRKKFQAAGDLAFAELEMPRRYANPVWPRALESARQARHWVSCAAYAWEHHIRVDMCGEEADGVLLDWQAEAAKNPSAALEMLHKDSAIAPGKAHGNHREAVRAFSDELQLHKFIAEYLAAIDQGRTPPGEPTVR